MNDTCGRSQVTTTLTAPRLGEIPNEPAHPGFIGACEATQGGDVSLRRKPKEHGRPWARSVQRTETRAPESGDAGPVPPSPKAMLVVAPSWHPDLG